METPFHEMYVVRAICRHVKIWDRNQEIIVAICLRDFSLTTS